MVAVDNKFMDILVSNTHTQTAIENVNSIDERRYNSVRNRVFFIVICRPTGDKCH